MISLYDLSYTLTTLSWKERSEKMAARLPKPQLRNLFGDYMKKNLIATLGLSIASTVPIYLWAVRRIKNKHLEYFSKTDPYVLQEQLIKDGAFSVVTPEGEVTWPED
ncbi:uncharacterized protein LOC125670645 [Ostrea edulis]|uniref:uncharacterized protein LOC125670645 n=1 Tax=Ostrea edulis TaxID=37623 RepID=UPI0020959490|nr:uncharacterized protein LOC125670645 [Ostrea edulis]XP_056018042.1 uncharacterized protein LOC125670645 [Ostrea edulis]